MKNSILLKSFFIFALIVSLSASTYNTYASEVTGNLSSGGVMNEQTSGSLSGQVSSVSEDNGSRSSSGSSRRSSSGSVLGESITVATIPDGSMSSDGTALTTSQTRRLSVVYGASDTSQTITETQLPEIVPSASAQVAATSPITDGENSGAWFWIILLMLLLIAGMIYLYKRSLGKSNKRIT